MWVGLLNCFRSSDKQTNSSLQFCRASGWEGEYLCVSAGDTQVDECVHIHMYVHIYVATVFLYANFMNPIHLCMCLYICILICIHMHKCHQLGPTVLFYVCMHVLFCNRLVAPV